MAKSTRQKKTNTQAAQTHASSINPTKIGLWSFALLIAYTVLYIALKGTLLLGFTITPQYLSPNFLLISLPVLALCIGIGFGILGRYGGKLGALIALSILFGVLIYLVASFLIYLVDGALLYEYQRSR